MCKWSCNVCRQPVGNKAWGQMSDREVTVDGTGWMACWDTEVQGNLSLSHHKCNYSIQRLSEKERRNWSAMTFWLGVRSCPVLSCFQFWREYCDTTVGQSEIKRIPLLIYTGALQRKELHVELIILSSIIISSLSSLWIPTTIVSMQRKTPHTTELVQCSAQDDSHYSNNSELTCGNLAQLVSVFSHVRAYSRPYSSLLS